jgi:hypothetical protein
MISGITNGVMSSISNGYNAICNNKATIAKVAAAASAVGLAVFLANNRSELIEMRNTITNMSNDIDATCEHPKESGLNALNKPGCSFGPTTYGQYDLKCQPHEEKFELHHTFNTKSDVEDQMKALYNNATIWGKDLFSSFAYKGEVGYGNGNRLPSVYLLICRETPLAYVNSYLNSFFPAV